METHCVHPAPGEELTMLTFLVVGLFVAHWLYLMVARFITRAYLEELWAQPEMKQALAQIEARNRATSRLWP